MAIKFDTKSVNNIIYKESSSATAKTVNKVIKDSVVVWCKPFSYVTGTLPTGVSALTCTRYATDEPSASTGTVANNGTIYYDDILYWTATAASGYTATVTHGSTSKVTVTGNINGVTTSGVSATPNPYPVTISATYCKATYLSTNSSATSGSASGTSFNYGSTVYGFATLNDNTTKYTYTAPSGWTQISGRTYRVGSTTVTTSGGSISVSATRTVNSYNITVTKNTGIANIYYKVNGASSWSTWSSGTISAKYDSTVYWYATCETGYQSSDIGSSSSPNSFTMGTSATIAPTASVKSYTLTFSVTGSSYGSFSVTRTPTYTGAPAEETWSDLADGATKTIYYGDELTATSSAASSRYTSWDCTPADLTVPTGSWNGGATTSPSITLTAKNTATANLYRRIKNSDGTYGSWTQLSSNWGTGTGATSSLTDTGLAFDTTYNYHVARYQNRTRYDRTKDSDNYTGTSSVSSALTATFKFYEDSGHAEQNWIGGSPSTVDISTGSQTYYTITFTRKIQPASGHQSLGTATADSSIGVASVSVPHGGSYSETFAKTNYVSQTKSGSNITASATVAVTLTPVQYTLGSSLTYWTGGWYTNNSYTGSTIGWMYHGYTAYFRATPNSRYGQTVSSTWYYNSKYYTKSVTSTGDSVTLNASAINYTVSGGSSAHGTISWAGNTYNNNANWSIAPDYGYNAPSPSTGSIKITTTNFTISDQYKTATYSGNLGDCTPQTLSFTVTKQYKAITGIQSKASSATADGTQTVSYTYNENYSYTYSKTGYDSQTVSGKWTSSSNKPSNTTITLEPHQYTLTKSLTYWTGDWYTASTGGSAITWMYYGYTSTFRGTPNSHYAQTIGSTRYYNGVTYTTTATSNNGSVTLSASAINYTITGGTATNGSVSWEPASDVYGGTPSWTITPNYGYNAPDPASGWKVINTDNFTISDANATATYSGNLGTCTAQSYTVTVTKNYYAITGVNSKASSTTADGTQSVTVTYNVDYSYTYSKTGYGSQTFSGKWTSASNKPATTQTLTLQPTQYSLTWSGSNWSGGWYTSTAYSTAITWRYYGYAAYFRATPNNHYEVTIGSTRYYNGQYYTASVATTSTSTGNVALTTAALIKYTITGTSSHGTVYWSTSAINSTGGSTSLTNVSYGTTVYYRIDADAGYDRPSTYYGSFTLNDTNFTVSDANKTATKTLSACTIKSYTITVTGSNCTITVGGTTRASGWSGTVNHFTEIKWTPNTYYSFNTGATQTNKTATVTGAGTYSNSPTAVRAHSIAIGTYNQSVNKDASTYYAADTYPIWTAKSSYSYGGSSTGDTKTGTVAITAGADLSAPNPGYVKCTISGTRCVANKTNNTIYAVNTQITWTADDNYSFASGSSRTATSTAGTNQGKVALAYTSYTHSADYGLYTVGSAPSHTTKNVSTGYYALTSKTTRYTADTGWYWDASGTNYKDVSGTPPCTITAPAAPTYCAITTGGTNCTASPSYTTSTIVANGTTISFTSNTNYSASSGATQTNPSSQTVSGPGSYTATSQYAKFTKGTLTNCTTTWTSGNYYRLYAYDNTSKVPFTSSDSTKYAFDSSGTASATTNFTAPGTYDKAASYKRLNITYSNCSKADAGTANGWYTDSSKTVAATGSTGWYFTSSSQSYSASHTLPSITTISPTYVLIKKGTCSNCSSVKVGSTDVTTSGIVARLTSSDSSSKVTYTAATNYSWAAGTSRTATTTTNITAPTTVNQSPGYGYWNITYTNCVKNSGTDNGYRDVNTAISATAKANAGWSFGGSTAQDTKTTNGGTAIKPPYSETLSPTYFYVTTSKGTGVASVTASGFHNSATTITSTADTGYAFDSSGTTTKSTENITSPTSVSHDCTHGYLTVPASGTNCTKTSGTTSSGWKAFGSYTANYTANSSYAFSSSGTTTKDSAAISVPGTITPPTVTHGYLTVSATNCKCYNDSACTDQCTSGWKPCGNYGTVYWKANANYSFGGSSTEDTTSTAGVTCPSTITKSPGNIYVTISGANNAHIYKYGTTTEASTGIYPYNQRLTYVPASYYSYSSGTTQTSKSDVYLTTAGGTYSYSPGYVAAASITTDSYSTKSAHVAGTYYAIGTQVTYNTVSDLIAYEVSSGQARHYDYQTITAGAILSAPEILWVYINSFNLTRCTADNPTHLPSGWLQDDFRSGWAWCTFTTTQTYYAFPADVNPSHPSTTYEFTFADYLDAVIAPPVVKPYPVSISSSGVVTITAWYNLCESNHTNSHIASISPEPPAFGTVLNKVYLFIIGDNYTATAATNYAYNSTGTTTTKTLTIDDSEHDKTSRDPLNWAPTYVNVTSLSGTHCTARVGSSSSSNAYTTGWKNISATIYWHASTNYAFNTTGTGSGGAYTTATPIGGANSKSATHGKLTATGTHCSVTDPTTTYVALSGNPYTVTWTADTNYAFDSSGTTTATTTNVTVPTSISKSATYLKYTLSLTNCTAKIGTTAVTAGTHYATSGTQITATANGGYAFDNSGTTSTSQSLTTAGQSITFNAGYVGANLGFTYCSASGYVSGMNWVALGTTITITADYAYAFDSSGTGTTSITVNAPTDENFEPMYGYLWFNCTNCAYYSGDNEGWYSRATTHSTTFKANSGYSIGGNDLEDTYTETGFSVPNNVHCTANWLPLKIKTVFNTYTGTSLLSRTMIYTHDGRLFSTLNYSGYIIDTTLAIKQGDVLQFSAFEVGDSVVNKSGYHCGLSIKKNNSYESQLIYTDPVNSGYYISYYTVKVINNANGATLKTVDISVSGTSSSTYTVPSGVKNIYISVTPIQVAYIMSTLYYNHYANATMGQSPATNWWSYQFYTQQNCGGGVTYYTYNCPLYMKIRTNSYSTGIIFTNPYTGEYINTWNDLDHSGTWKLYSPSGSPKNITSTEKSVYQLTGYAYNGGTYEIYDVS